MLPRAFLLSSIIALAFFTSGCANRFDRVWQDAAARPKENPYAGRWKGEWQSEKHRGASGELRAVVTPLGHGVYRGDFKAHWMLFVSSYSMEFRGDERKGMLDLEGEYDLGLLFGGVYTLNGRATPDRIRASYDSRYDRGVFELTRP